MEKSPQTSKFCFATPAEYPLEARKQALVSEGRSLAGFTTGQCVFRDFYQAQNPRTLKHHQWAVFSQRHARALVETAKKGLKVWERSWRAAAPDLVAMGEGCSDEGAPIAALLHWLEESAASTGDAEADLEVLGVEQQCLTWVRWRNCFSGSDLDLRSGMDELRKVYQHWDHRMVTDKAFDFLKSPLKAELNGFPHAFQESVETGYLRKLVQDGFMFGRKFGKSTKVVSRFGAPARPLEDLLPQLWKYGTDEATAERRVWSRLETAGQPLEDDDI